MTAIRMSHIYVTKSLCFHGKKWFQTYCNSEIFARVLLSCVWSFAKIKPSLNGENSLSFTDVGKSCQSLGFLTWLILMLFVKIKFSRKFPNLQYVNVIWLIASYIHAPVLSNLLNLLQMQWMNRGSLLRGCGTHNILSKDPHCTAPSKSNFYRLTIWAATWDFQQCGMCDQQSLRPACAYGQSDQSLC